MNERYKVTNHQAIRNAQSFAQNSDVSEVHSGEPSLTDLKAAVREYRRGITRDMDTENDNA